VNQLASESVYIGDSSQTTPSLYDVNRPIYLQFLATGGAKPKNTLNIINICPGNQIVGYEGYTVYALQMT